MEEHETVPSIPPLRIHARISIALYTRWWWHVHPLLLLLLLLLALLLRVNNGWLLDNGGQVGDRRWWRDEHLLCARRFRIVSVRDGGIRDKGQLPLTAIWRILEDVIVAIVVVVAVVVSVNESRRRRGTGGEFDIWRHGNVHVDVEFAGRVAGRDGLGHESHVLFRFRLVFGSAPLAQHCLQLPVCRPCTY